MRRLLALLIIIASFMAISSVNAQEELEVRIYVFGPEIVATGSVSVFNVNVVGGPAELGGNYSIEAHLEGTNLTGALPVRASPFQVESDTGNFTVNVTAPRIPQTMSLVINATSIKDEERVSSETKYEIEVVEPVILSARIENTGSLRLENVIVKFYVDNEFVGNKTIASITAGNSTTVSYDWLVGEIAPGQHEIRVTVDMNGDGVVKVSDGDLVMISYFYREYGDIHPAIIAIVSIIMILMVFILFRTIRRKRRGW